jgi:peptidyl-prolyl cis-trans isomerase SurA
MKKGISFLTALFLFTNVHAQTLFTYGDKKVSKQEFLEAYKKNQQSEVTSDSMYRYYLDLYTKYKLKVQSAYDERIDTLSAISDELQNYKRQVLPEYLKTLAGYDAIAEMEWKRASKEILLQHIFLPFEAEAKIHTAYEELKKGGKFEEVAVKFSDDPAVSVNKGTVGYLTAMVLPLKIESELYALKPNEYSKPFRTNAGWHIVRNGNERDTRGKVKVKQILFAYPPEASAADKKTIQNRADSVRKVLNSGGSFSEMAELFSDDQFSFRQGGQLPAFGAGVYDSRFEEKAFSLNKKDELSEPFETAYGIHLLQLVEKIPYTATLDSIQRVELIQEIQSGDREQLAMQQLVQTLATKLKVKDANVDETVLNQFTKSVLASPGSQSDMGLKPSTVLFTIANKPVTIKEYRENMEEIAKAGSFSNQDPKEFYTTFRQNKILDFYQENAEQYDAEFKKQMEEFKEGSMLFYVMEKNVWGMAASDTAGLRKYFDAHRDQYWWNKSAEVLIFNSSNKELVETIREVIGKDPAKWTAIAQQYENQLQVDSGRYEITQLPGSPGSVIEKESTEIVQLDDVYSFAYVLKLYAERSPRTFEQSLGLVINDYQAVLEEKWINELKKKYPVKVNEKVLRGMR